MPAVKRNCGEEQVLNNKVKNRIVFTGRITMLEEGILTPLSPLWAKAVTAIKAIDDAVSKPIDTVTMVLA